MRIAEVVIGNGVAVPQMVSLSAGMDNLDLILLLGMEDGILPMMMYLSVR